MLIMSIGNVIGTLLIARLELKYRAVGFFILCVSNTYWIYYYLNNWNTDMLFLFASFFIIAVYGLIQIRSAYRTSSVIIEKSDMF